MAAAAADKAQGRMRGEFMKVTGSADVCGPGRAARAPLAFTLVELLVVMAIISMLVALALPAMVRARRLALTVSCKNNLREIIIGLENYRVSWREWPPGRNTNRISRPGEKIGLGHLAPDYIGDVGVFYCPAASKIRLGEMSISTDEVGKVDGVCSYLYKPAGAEYLGAVVGDYNGGGNRNHKGETLNLLQYDGSVKSVRR